MANIDRIISYALSQAKLTEIQSYVWARYLEGLKHREIAEEIGRSRQYVSAIIKVCKHKMQSINKPICNKFGNISPSITNNKSI